MMGRALWLADVARSAGLHVFEVDGWKTRGNANLSPQVLICHHTGDSLSAGNAGGLGVVVNGRTGLPGPIANYFLARNGDVYVVASGISNNAGVGNARIIGRTDINQNYQTVSIEGVNNGGSEPWNNYQAYVKLVTAILKYKQWDISKIIAHKEWALPQGRKDDPTFDMNKFRLDVYKQMSGSNEDEDMVVISGIVPNGFAYDENGVLIDKTKKVVLTIPLGVSTKDHYFSIANDDGDFVRCRVAFNDNEDDGGWEVDTVDVKPKFRINSVSKLLNKDYGKISVGRQMSGDSNKDAISSDMPTTAAVSGR
jgi:hypothetical protein